METHIHWGPLSSIKASVPGRVDADRDGFSKLWYWRCFKGVLQSRDPLVVLDILFERARNQMLELLFTIITLGNNQTIRHWVGFLWNWLQQFLRNHWTCHVRFKTDISVLLLLMFFKFEFAFDEFSHCLDKMPCILFPDEFDFSSLVPFNVLKLKRWNTGLYFHIR